MLLDMINVCFFSTRVATRRDGSRNVDSYPVVVVVVVVVVGVQEGRRASTTEYS